MMKVALAIEDMACGMCEAHINEAVRRVVPDAKKMKSSFRKGECVFLSEQRPDEEKLRDAIAQTGYILRSMECAAEERKARKRLFF